jgi:hypothetical protein
MRRLREVFTLTVAEQRVIVVVFVALVLLITAKTYRDRLGESASLVETRDQPSPSPGIRP